MENSRNTFMIGYSRNSDSADMYVGMKLVKNLIIFWKGQRIAIWLFEKQNNLCRETLFECYCDHYGIVTGK